MKQFTGNRQSPLRERLMWERAEIADQLLWPRPQTGDTFSDDQYYNIGNTIYEFQPDEQQFFNRETTSLLNQASVREMYEEILLEFPEGFYAHYAREKLQQSNAQTL